MPSPLDLYLDEIRRVRETGAGTRETSYYPAIAMALNAVGAALKPRVYCLHHPTGTSGIPDFGLFENRQFRGGEPPAWNGTIVPERGVVELKGVSHPIATLIASAQVREQYLPVYGVVLASNLRQFACCAQTARCSSPSILPTTKPPSGASQTGHARAP